MAAPSPSPLSLSTSRPRLEGAPITFKVSGVAGKAVYHESVDYVQGIVVHARRKCPAHGADSYGDVHGAYARTFHAFPTGPFELTYRMRPSGINPEALPAGRWRQCAYLQDRGTNAVVAFGQQTFAVRRPRVSIAVKRPLPRHFKPVPTLFGWQASATFKVRARIGLPRRTLAVGVTLPGYRGTCSKLLFKGDGHRRGLGFTDNDVRLKAGAAHTYRVHIELDILPGEHPYGKRVRVCAAVHYKDPRYGTNLVEGSAQLPLMLRR